MSDRTPEQVAADNQLDEAIRAAAAAYGTVSDGEVITGWVVAGSSQGDDDHRSAYFTLLPGGVQPTHIAIGLLRCAERFILSDDE